MSGCWIITKKRTRLSCSSGPPFLMTAEPDGLISDRAMLHQKQLLIATIMASIILLGVEGRTVAQWQTSDSFSSPSTLSGAPVAQRFSPQPNLTTPRIEQNSVQPLQHTSWHADSTTQTPFVGVRNPIYTATSSVAQTHSPTAAPNQPQSGYPTQHVGNGHCPQPSCVGGCVCGAGFISNPNYDHVPYDSDAEIGVYTDKWCLPAQRPLIEEFRGLYRSGEIPAAKTFLGITNPIIPHFLLFGDYRTALAYVDNGVQDKAIWAHRLNLDFDWKITSTERFHAFWGPIDEDGRFTRVEANDGEIDLLEEFDDDIDTAFLEGDLGYIWGGLIDRWAPFDLPFVAGKFPMLFQNGTWMLDVLEGFAFTIQAQNSRHLDISNFDITFFFAFDDVDGPAFRGDDNAADMYGFHGFFEMLNGYLEVGYAFLDDTTGQNLSYHNVGISYSRRYRHRVSNAIRVITNFGQDDVTGGQTADGTLVLFENALISRQPNYFVPYFNLFALSFRSCGS